MNQEELDAARKALLEMRRQVLQEANVSLNAYREMGQENLPDISDVSANAANRNVLLNLSENLRQKLRDIDAALERIDQGEYGVCASCEEEISPERMRVRPFSRYCIECKTEIEKFGE
ncbi:MAG: TraR/DksA family transcriptional regulator [Geothermobacteraceae bacterium]